MLCRYKWVRNYNMNILCFINGEIKNINEGSIGLKDLALQRGYGVFDYARTFNRKLFHFEDHLERFRRSAKELRLDLNYTNAQITENAETLLKGSDLKNPALRLILTGGYIYSPSGNFNPNFIMIAEELPTYPEENYTHGVKLLTYEYQRELPHVKSINYLNDIRLDPLRREKNVFDILYYFQNGITECPRNNFFVFINDVLITPKDFLLHGVTRKVVLEMANKYWKVEERKLELAELNSADEAFITSTTKSIMPVTVIDDKKIGNGTVGMKTQKLIKLFNDYVLQFSR